MFLRLEPFIKHGKFQTLHQVLQDYEKHCKKRVISQTPSLINQFIFKVKEQVTDAQKGNQDERSAEI